jgi:23S rRNA (uracil1939-C5)-methyltransferase
MNSPIPLKDYNYEEHLEYKLSKYPKGITYMAKNRYGYRNKARFLVKNGTIGTFYNYGGKYIKEDDINLVHYHPRIIELLYKLRQSMIENIDSIIIRYSFEYDEIMLILLTDKIVSVITVYEKTKELNISSLYLNNTLVSGKDRIKEKIGNYIFGISPKGFFQTNPEITQYLYDKIRFLLIAESESKVLLDLYGGAGTIGIYCSDLFERVITVESNNESIRDGLINRIENKVSNIEFINDKTENVISKLQCKCAVVIDPPRAGLHKDVIDNLNNFKIRTIIYVSCNPETFYRDTKLLNYELKNVYYFDMFPYTHHIEMIGLFKRKN